MTTVPLILVHDLPGSSSSHAEVLAVEVFDSEHRCDALIVPTTDGHRVPWRSGIYDPQEETVASVTTGGVVHADRSSVETALFSLLSYAGQPHTGPVIVRLQQAETYVIAEPRGIPVFSVVG